MQAVFDLLLVTAVVHLTNGTASPFAALYILVIATASLLVPVSGGLVIAALGIAFYFTDVVLILHSPLSDPGVWLQLAVIASVTLGIRYLSARLRESGEGKAMLVAALEQTRLQADDILATSAGGVITVNAEGRCSSPTRPPSSSSTSRSSRNSASRWSNRSERSRPTWRPPSSSLRKRRRARRAAKAS